MQAHIQIKLYATLREKVPPAADQYPIEPGDTLREVLRRLGIPLDQAKLVFIDGLRKGLDTRLNGGERVGVFPPVGGG